MSPVVGPDENDVSVTVARLRRIVFESASAETPPDAIVVIDAAGNHLPLGTPGRAGMRSDRAPLRAGRSAVLTVTEDAREVVVLRGARELGRVELPLLVPGETTVVRWP